MKKSLLLVVFLFALSLTAGQAAAVEFGVRGTYWFPTMGSSIQVDANQVNGFEFDITDDLKVDDKNYPVIQAFFRTGAHSFEFVYTYVDFSSQTILTQGRNFAGVLYPQNSQVDFALEYKSIDLRYGYRLVNWDDVLNGFSLYGLVDLKMYDGETSLKATGLDNSKSFNAFIPMFGLDFHLTLLADLLKARIVFAVEPVGDSNAGEVAAHVAWTPTPFVDVVGGYRVLLLRIEEDDLKFSHRLNGPYVGLTVSF